MQEVRELNLSKNGRSNVDAGKIHEGLVRNVVVSHSNGLLSVSAGNNVQCSLQRCHQYTRPLNVFGVSISRLESNTEEGNSVQLECITYP